MERKRHEAEALALILRAFREARCPVSVMVSEGASPRPVIAVAPSNRAELDKQRRPRGLDKPAKHQARVTMLL